MCYWKNTHTAEHHRIGWTDQSSVVYSTSSRRMAVGNVAAICWQPNTTRRKTRCANLVALTSCSSKNRYPRQQYADIGANTAMLVPVRRDQSEQAPRQPPWASTYFNLDSHAGFYTTGSLPRKRAYRNRGRKFGKMNEVSILGGEQYTSFYTTGKLGFGLTKKKVRLGLFSCFLFS